MACCLSAAWSTAAQAQSDWQFAGSFYAWISDLEGDIRASGPVEPVQVDLSHSKVLEHLKFAGFGLFEAHKGHFVAMTDLTYAHLAASSGIEVRDVDLLEADLDASAFTATVLGGYRVAEGSVNADLLAGARLVNSDTDLVLSGPQRTVEGDVTETWIDPILATHIGIPVSSKTTMTFYGDMGGGSSDFTWQAIIGLQYRLSSHWQLTAGWRHFAVDYDKGDFLYDVKQSGPVLGARFEF
jgi:opacity protein-like surface antigen